MKRRAPLFVSFLCLCSVGCGQQKHDSIHSDRSSNPLEWCSFHTEEANWWKERTGFRDGAGNTVIPARFLDADCAFFEGFAWVNTKVCDATKDHPDIPYAGPFDMESCGNFIDAEGRPLLSIHAHTVHEPAGAGVGMEWQIWPRFNHGLAFVRLADGLVYGVTTNGTILSCHESLGSFAPLRGRGCDEEPYWFYRGDWALVGLQDGRAGILGPDHGFAVGPSEDMAEVEALWKDGLKRLDPFDFEGANSTPWLRVRLKFDDSATMTLGYLLQVLEKRSYECLYPTIDKYGYLHPHYLIMDAEWGLERMSVHVPAGDHTVRTLLEMAAEQTGAFPLLTRFSAVFIDLPQYPRDKDGPVVLPFRTKPSGLLSESPSADP